MTASIAAAASSSDRASIASTMRSWLDTFSSCSAMSWIGELMVNDATSAVSMTPDTDRSSALPDALAIA